MVGDILAENRYDASTGILRFTAPEVASFYDQQKEWTTYFAGSRASHGLAGDTIEDPEELRVLTAYFAWAAWAAAAHIPGTTHSYTNNFPYDPAMGNGPSGEAILWIATAYVGGGLFLASAIGRREPKGQARATNVLFVALAIVVFGSLAGEYLGVRRLLGDVWFWFGNQGWEYLEIGRAWQILLTLEASDFVGLMRSGTDPDGNKVPFPHRWTFYFLIAVGVWNFIGAGIFGFLINLPVVSYYEVGTQLTPNHGHGALMGVFGMLAVALTVFALRQVSTDSMWQKTEKLVKVSFWGLNIGLAGMLILQLFPMGVAQLADVIRNGYWHARSPAFTESALGTIFGWARLPADIIFILFGVLPLLAATVLTYLWARKPPAESGVQ